MGLFLAANTSPALSASHDDMILLAAIGLFLAAGPAVLFMRNLSAYTPLPQASDRVTTPCSVLIPARNEEVNIGGAVDSVLRNRDIPFEVLVLDDDSDDATAEIVREIAKGDRRVQLGRAPTLPPGWSGKQHACHVLGTFARHPFLVFMDADVRLAPDALSRIVAYMEKTEVRLASSVPRQETETLSERLLLPLIHFVLLGFLPLRRMRQSSSPALAAGCGQLFIARRTPISLVRVIGLCAEALHDGTKLPRVFRAAGFKTDLFDATDIAICRMYRTIGRSGRTRPKRAGGAWSPSLIGPATMLLFGGQVLPLFLLLGARSFLVLSYPLWPPSLFTFHASSRCDRFRQSFAWRCFSSVRHLRSLIHSMVDLFPVLVASTGTWKARSYQPA